MTMRLPVDTFVMSAASGDCLAEGGRVLPLLLGGVGVFCVSRVSWLSRGWGLGIRPLKRGGGGLRLGSRCVWCVCVCMCVPAPQGGVAED